jgi:hypothetical protein
MRNARSAVWIAALLPVLSSCSHATSTTSPAQSPQPTNAHAKPSPTPQPSPTGAPTTPAPPVITPTPNGSNQPPSTAPHIGRKVTRLAPDAAPQILAVAVTETTVQPGDRVSGSVVTSSNVASVEARIGGYAVTLSKVGVGRFALTYTVGPLPWFVRGNFTMQVIARNARGDAARRAIPLTVR